MAKKTKEKFDCMKCPAYCCSYPRICLKKKDIQRLADHFGCDFETAKRRYTKKGHEKGEIVLRHKADEHFGTICRFIDSETRQCGIYEARPEICRDFPGTKRCGYYEFLKFERRALEDPDYISITNNT